VFKGLRFKGLTFSPFSSTVEAYFRGLTINIQFLRYKATSEALKSVLSLTNFKHLPFNFLTLLKYLYRIILAHEKIATDSSFAVDHHGVRTKWL